MKTQHLISVGFLVQEHQMSYRSIVETLAAAGLKPVQTMNLVPYYDLYAANRVFAPDQVRALEETIEGVPVDE